MNARGTGTASLVQADKQVAFQDYKLSYLNGAMQFLPDMHLNAKTYSAKDGSVRADFVVPSGVLKVTPNTTSGVKSKATQGFVVADLVGLEPPKASIHPIVIFAICSVFLTIAVVTIRQLVIKRD